MNYTLDCEQEAEAEIKEVIACHIEGLKEDGLPVPVPTSTVEYIELVA
jgi:predicted RNase H-like HicB family nuclease